MPFDPTLPHPLPEVDPELFDELLSESQRFVDSHDYRVMSDELPTRFLDFWLIPIARTETKRRRYETLCKSNEKGVLLQLPLHLFDYVYNRRFDSPTDLVENEPSSIDETADLKADVLHRFDSDPEFRAGIKLFMKRLHQFYVLLQYIRIMNELGMVRCMYRFDLFDVDAYEDVLTDIAGDLAETAIDVLDHAIATQYS